MKPETAIELIKNERALGRLLNKLHTDNFKEEDMDLFYIHMKNVELVAEEVGVPPDECRLDDQLCPTGEGYSWDWIFEGWFLPEEELSSEEFYNQMVEQAAIPQ